jgi:beta-mannosidase
MEPFERYEEKIGRFHSEHGFQALPMMPSLQRFIPEDELHLGSASMRSHQKHPTGYETIQAYMAREYPVPEDLESFAYVSQLLQAKGLSKATRAHRLAKPYTMGSLYWQLNDVWPVTSWSSMDYFGRPKALHYALKSDFAPLMVQLRMLEDQDAGEVWIVSDRRDTVELSLHFAFMDFRGELLEKDERIINIEPMNAKVYAQLPVYTEPERKNSFVVLQLWDEDVLLAEYRHYWDKPKDLPLQPTFQSARWVDNTTIELSTLGGMAKDVYVEAGDYIVEDNFFDAIPGTTRLRVRKHPKDDARPEIKVRNLNEWLLRE